MRQPIADFSLTINWPAARGLRSDCDIDLIELDSHFSKVRVWERGYFYAAASQVTSETVAFALFVLEKMDDGRWLILAREARS